MKQKDVLGEIQGLDDRNKRSEAEKEPLELDQHDEAVGGRPEARDARVLHRT